MKAPSYLHTFWKIAGLLVLPVAAGQRLAAQTCDSACQSFIAATVAAVSTLENSLGPATQPVILGANLVYANGALVDQIPLSALLQYVEGLKAAGVERIDLNPGVTSINDPTAAAAYDAIVTHIRELGMQLALNPTVIQKDFPGGASFSGFQTTALSTYPAMAARWQPDNFVIVHEPTTQNARLGIAATATTAEWGGFIQAVAPLIRAASPHIRLGAGGFYDSAENTYFAYNVTLPQLDFMTMDVYQDQYFTQLDTWVSMAHSNGKGIYMEETWVPEYLPATLPPGWQSNPEGVDAYAFVGNMDMAFASMDAAWLQGMAMYASANQMEAVTPFNTEALFFYGQPGNDKPFGVTFISDDLLAIENGQLTSTAQAFAGVNAKLAVKQVTSVSSASYATLQPPSVFTPSCGACYGLSIVAPDELVSAFGADLATTTVLDGAFPTTLGGTTTTLVDSSNTSYQVQMFFVSPAQVNYYVPAKVQAGPATLTIKSGDGTQTSGTVLVAPVMPGIYTATANGQGAPAAVALIVHAGGSQSTQLTYTCSSAASCSPAPISLASTDSLYIELYGTGIRHVSTISDVTATVNGQSVTVQYAGASGHTGEDQVNIQIPQSLFNSGIVNLVLTVNGQLAPSNAVELNLQ